MIVDLMTYKPWAWVANPGQKILDLLWEMDLVDLLYAEAGNDRFD